MDPLNVLKRSSTPTRSVDKADIIPGLHALGMAEKLEKTGFYSDEANSTMSIRNSLC